MEEKTNALKKLKMEIIFNALMMIIWVVILIIRLTKNTEDTFGIILYSVCIALFLAAMIVCIVKYRKLKKEQ